MDIDNLVRAPATRAKAVFLDNLHPDWRNILKRSWSLRFMALAAILSFAEAACMALTGQTLIEPIKFAFIYASIAAAAFVARLKAQKNMGVKE